MPHWFDGFRRLVGGAARSPAVPPAELELMHMSSRQRGTAAACRGAVSVLLAAQLLLWLHRTANGSPALWQAALLLCLPAAGVWALSAAAWRGDAARRPWEKLLLLPCLLLDAASLLHALLSLLTRMMPSYPAGLLRAAIPLLLTAAVLLGRARGAVSGAFLWRRVLILPAVVLVWQTVSQQGFDRLFPILGDGVLPTLRQTLSGLGALWPIGLLFAVPPAAPEKKHAGAMSAALPLLGVCGFGLALGCAAPWPADALTGERLLWLSRSSGSITVGGLGAALWLLMLMLGWCVAILCIRLICTQVFPKLTGSLPVLAGAALSMLPLWLWPRSLPSWLLALLPWRLAMWAAAALWGAVRRRR